jgi:hypothetical protein
MSKQSSNRPMALTRNLLNDCIYVLAHRCLAQYGPTARSYDVGNRAGGQFDRLGQAMKRLLDAFVSAQARHAAAAAAAAVMALPAGAAHRGAAAEM